MGLFLTPFLFNPFTGDVEGIKTLFLSSYILLLFTVAIFNYKKTTSSNIATILSLTIGWMIITSIIHYHDFIILGAIDRYHGLLIWMASAMIALITPFFITNISAIKKQTKALIVVSLISTIAALPLAFFIEATVFEDRIGGLTGNPNVLGKLILFVLIILGISLEQGKSQKKTFEWIGASILFLGLIATGNRASWLGIIIVAIIYIFREKQRAIKYLLASLGIVLLLTPFLWNRISNFTSLGTRSEIYTMAVSKILEQPLTGYGFEFGPEVLNPDLNVPFVADRAHQLFLDIGLVMGTPGILLFLTFTVLSLKKLLRDKNSLKRSIGYALLGLFISLQFSFFSGISFLLYFFAIGVSLIPSSKSKKA